MNEEFHEGDERYTIYAYHEGHRVKFHFRHDMLSSNYSSFERQAILANIEQYGLVFKAPPPHHSMLNSTPTGIILYNTNTYKKN